MDRQGRVEEAEGLGQVAGAAWGLRSERTWEARRNMPLTNQSFVVVRLLLLILGLHELI